MISCFIVFSLYFFHFSLEKTNDFGVSLEILQTLSKLTPNPLQTHVFRFFCFFFGSFLFILLFWEKGNEFGVSLGIFQTHPKLKK